MERDNWMELENETWHPSVKLRDLKQENYLILQQLYVSNLGNELWQNVEIVNE